MTIDEITARARCIRALDEAGVPPDVRDTIVELFDADSRTIAELRAEVARLRRNLDGAHAVIQRRAAEAKEQRERAEDCDCGVDEFDELFDAGGDEREPLTDITGCDV